MNEQFDYSEVLQDPDNSHMQLQVPIPNYGFSLAMALYSPMFRSMRFFSSFRKNPLLNMNEEQLSIRYATELQTLGKGLEFFDGIWQDSASENAKEALREDNLIRIATFNVQDAVRAMDFFLVPEFRYSYQINVLLPNLKADIICFNEVTPRWQEILFSSGFIRNHYYVSQHCSNSHFGNLILSRFPFNQVYQSSRIRAVHGLIEVEGQSILISSVHWIAYQEYFNVRKAQIQQTIKSIESQLGKVPVVMLGDWNLHNTATNEEHLIEPYIDVWKRLKPEDEGITWDAINNPMTKKMYPLDGRRMRLDRITISPEASQVMNPVSIDIFAKERIASESQYYSYLSCSDHYGLVADFKLLK